MFTLDIKKTVKTYIIIILACFIVSAIYEYFSHGVYSNYMIYAGIVPLIGLVITLIIHKYFSRFSFHTFNSLIATLTTYSYMMGVLEIYGTTNPLIQIYLIAALILFNAFIITTAIKIAK